jgi:hypothetical protein
MKATAVWGMIPFLLLSVVACDDSMSAGADYDRNVDFTIYHTFAWEEADLLPVGDPRLDGNPFFVERIQDAVNAELAARGLERVEVGPSLLVHYHAVVRDRVDVYEVDRRAGYDVPEYGPGTAVRQFEEGTLMVDLVDAETLRVIWRGWARADVTRLINQPEALARLVEEAARAMFQHFPRETVSHEP